MNKKEDKFSEMVPLMQSFLREKNYTINYKSMYSYRSQSVVIIPSGGEDPHADNKNYEKFLIELWLKNKTTVTENGNKFIEFLQYLMKKQESKHAIDLALNNLPSKSNINPEKVIKTIVDTLSYNKQNVLGLAKRKVFWSSMPVEKVKMVLQYLETQEDIRTVFDTLATNKSFQVLDIQKQLYGIFNEKLKKFNEIEHLFDIINKKDKLSYKTSKLDLYHIEYNLKDMASYMLQNKQSLDDINSYIDGVFRHYQKKGCLENVTFSSKYGNAKLTLTGKNIDQDFLNILFETTLEKLSVDPFANKKTSVSIWSEDFQEFCEEVISYAEKKYLMNNLSDINEKVITKKKNKI